MGQPSPIQVSSHALLEGALTDAIARLRRGGSSTERRALLVEARRLKSVLDTWHAIPPPQAGRREMLARVMQLAAIAGSSDGELATQEQRPTKPTPPPGSATRVAHAAPPSAVSATRLMRHIRVSSGIAVTRTEAVEWRPFPRAVGVSIKVLHRNHDERTYTALVHVAPGAEMPRHRHAASEEMYVVEGSLELGDVEMEAGDYCRSETDSIHEPARSPAGCTVLLVGSEEDELLDEITT